MANRHMKRQLIIREMHIKTTVSVVSPHTCQNGSYQKDKKQQVLAKMWRKGNTSALLVGMSTGAATVKKTGEKI